MAPRAAAPATARDREGLAAVAKRSTARVLTRPDFAEGVRAVIVDKTNDPKWDPATAEGVTDALIDSIFAPLPADKEWKPL